MRLAFLLVAGCVAPPDTGDSVRAGDSDVDGGAPTLALTPETLDFGTVPVGTSAQATFAVGSVGAAPLHVDALSLAFDAATAFSYAPASPTPWSLDPGDTVTVDVTFTPTDDAPVSAGLLVVSDDPLAPVTTLPLTGNQVPPADQADAVSGAPQSLQGCPVRSTAPRREPCSSSRPSPSPPTPSPDRGR
jgi:hypothetical protein